DSSMYGHLWGTPAVRALFEEGGRSEEHTSELQSQSNLVCRLLLEKKKNETRQHVATNALTIPHIPRLTRHALFQTLSICHILRCTQSKLHMLESQCTHTEYSLI